MALRKGVPVMGHLVDALMAHAALCRMDFLFLMMCASSAKHASKWRVNNGESLPVRCCLYSIMRVSHVVMTNMALVIMEVSREVPVNRYA